MTKQLLLTLALAGTCSMTANAELINVQFGCSASNCAGQSPNTTSTQFTGMAATGVNSTDYWNMVLGSGGLGVTKGSPGSNLYDRAGTGNPATATLTWSASGHTVVDGANGTTGTFADLVNTYVYDDSTSTSSFTVFGLTANKYYNLYLYNQGDNTTGQSVQYTINGVTQTQTNSTTNASKTALVANVNYEMYTVYTGSGGQVTVDFASTSTSAKGVVNGFQLETSTATPEPGTIGMALGGIAMVGIGRLRRKKVVL